ncbi:MAG: Putative iron-sulfur cluster assembly scaffold protein for SUF system, SufE2, partial [uncultured Rubrobacteraceae bacterium]
DAGALQRDRSRPLQAAAAQARDLGRRDRGAPEQPALRRRGDGLRQPPERRPRGWVYRTGLRHKPGIGLDAGRASGGQGPRGGGRGDRSLPGDDAHGARRGPGRPRRPQGRRPDPQPYPLRHPRLGRPEARARAPV